MKCIGEVSDDSK